MHIYNGGKPTLQYVIYIIVQFQIHHIFILKTEQKKKCYKNPVDLQIKKKHPTLNFAFVKRRNG